MLPIKSMTALSELYELFSGAHSNLEYVLVKFFCPNKSDNKFMNYRQQTPIFH